MRSKLRTLWWALMVLTVVLLAGGYYEDHRLRAAFAALRAASKSDADFAVRATSRLNALQRQFALGPDAQRADTSSFSYRLPLVVLNGGGGCSQRSALLVAVLSAHDIPARKLLIGLTDEHAAHVVVEALLDGKWRVLDPLFGYVYRLDGGELATASDLREKPELVARVARTDAHPFPFPYRLDAFNYRRATHFNWFRSSTTLALRESLGPGADRFGLPAMWDRPLRVAAFGLMLLLLPLTWLRVRHRATRIRSE